MTKQYGNWVEVAMNHDTDDDFFKVKVLASEHGMTYDQYEEELNNDDDLYEEYTNYEIDYDNDRDWQEHASEVIREFEGIELEVA
jgi:hypothetical protein